MDAIGGQIEISQVEENAPVGTVVGQVSVRDADRTEANRKVRFSLRGRPEDLFLVDIDRTTGQMNMRRPVDYEKQSSISLTVVAENDAPLASSAIPGRPPSSSAYQTEASVIINVLNVNDNRPEFIPIAPHRKHIIFAWEQLPLAGSNQTTGKNQRRFCEPIPYKVIDKDCDPASREFCCTLELENTYDGMFGLLEEIPNVLCALKRPSQPQSYKLMLKARDGNGNDSLSSQRNCGLCKIEIYLFHLKTQRTTLARACKVSIIFLPSHPTLHRLPSISLNSTLPKSSCQPPSSEDLMADNTITSEMKRHAAIVSIKAKYRNLEVARFLKVSRSFVCKVRKDPLNENNEDELTATRKKKEYCQRSAD
ncbi:hypothetical protein ACTXT7_007586 [Hymenolepis weldensis]